MTKTRVGWVDIAKYIAIFFVMVHHLETRPESMANIYVPLTLETFYFTAGYVYKNRVGFGKFLKKKAQQLLVPWFVFSNFIILTRHLVSFHGTSDMLAELQGNLLQAGGSNQELWFLAALFAAFIPFYFIIRLIEHYASRWEGTYYVALVVGFVGMYVYTALHESLKTWIPEPWCNLWHVDLWMYIVFFMLVGYVYAHSAEHRLAEAGSARWRWLTLALYALVLIPRYRGMALADNVVWERIVCLAGVAAVITVSKMIDHNRFMEYCGQNTLIFFAFHGKVTSALEAVFRKIVPTLWQDVLASEWKCWIASIALALLLSVILIVPSYIINRWFPFLVGRMPAKKTQNA